MNLNLTQSMPSMDNVTNQIQQNPTILITLSVVIILYYFVFSYLGSDKTSMSPSLTSSVSSSMSSMFSSSPDIQTVSTPSTFSSGLSFIEILLWGLLIFLILINGIQYFFEIDINTAIKNIFTPKPEVDITIQQEQDEEPIPEITYEKQVFHIPKNIYTYDDAKALCKAYGADLANYEQIEKAYNNGAEWCGYGWSDKQMALYPTQQKTYNKLQNIKGHEHNCGRPGINGGYIANPNVRFGANCYGYKPDITTTEQLEMNNLLEIPKTQDEIKFEKKIEMYRTKLPEIMVAPFNNSTWSQI